MALLFTQDLCPGSDENMLVVSTRLTPQVSGGAQRRWKQLLSVTSDAPLVQLTLPGHCWALGRGKREAKAGRKWVGRVGKLGTLIWSNLSLPSERSRLKNTPKRHPGHPQPSLTFPDPSAA